MTHQTEALKAFEEIVAEAADNGNSLESGAWLTEKSAVVRAALSSQPPAPSLPLDFKPHFADCETAEPSLSNLIHRYYGFYFDKPRSTEYAKAYIEALSRASLTATAGSTP